MSHLLPAARMLAVLAAGAALTMLAACGGGSGGGSTQGSGSPSPASSSGSAPATPAPKKAPKPPGLVAVTKAGALVLLGSRHGQVIRTLVAGGVRGDEVSVSPDHSTVYFSVRHGCLGQIESVPVAGGSPTVIADGTVPAISPDGTRLAYATAPLQTGACVPGRQRADQAVHAGDPHAEHRHAGGLPAAPGRPGHRPARADLAPVLVSRTAAPWPCRSPRSRTTRAGT